MIIASLDDLFLHTLKDVLFSERKLLKMLLKMECKATSVKLKTAFSGHLYETEERVFRLEAVFESMGKPARGAKCDAMVGLLDEADNFMADIDDAETLDCALISLVQAIEHYEIARYGTLVAWANKLGNTESAALLKATLDEEYVIEKALSRMAGERLNAISAA